VEPVLLLVISTDKLHRIGQLGAAFGEDRLAIAHLFDGILVAPFGHL
jgi:hypothetical protein